MPNKALQRIFLRCAQANPLKAGVRAENVHGADSALRSSTDEMVRKKTAISERRARRRRLKTAILHDIRKGYQVKCLKFKVPKVKGTKMTITCFRPVFIVFKNGISYTIKVRKQQEGMVSVKGHSGSGSTPTPPSVNGLRSLVKQLFVGSRRPWWPSCVPARR